MEHAAEEDITLATNTIWSANHGIANLYAGAGPSLEDDPELDALVRRATEIVFVGMRHVGS